jgi:hypothetical protein
MLRAAFRDIQKDWPWLISAASDAWVMGYILFNRWRRRGYAAHYVEPLLARVEWAIKDIEHQMWLGRYSLRWYILPIPPVLFFAMDYGKRPRFASLNPLLVALAVFAAVSYSVYRVMKYGERFAVEARRRELLALRTLRESLLHTGE